MAGWFYVVQDNTTPYWVLLTLAFMCGIGGGAFSGYMPSTGYFFPKRLAGTASACRAASVTSACPSFCLLVLC